MCLPASQRYWRSPEILGGMVVAESARFGLPGRNGLSPLASDVEATSRAEPVHVWISTVLDLLTVESLSAPATTRVFIGAAAAMYESTAPGVTGRRSLASRVPGLIEVPSFACCGQVDWHTALSAAVYTVLEEALPLEAAGAATLLECGYAWQVLIRRTSGVDERVMAVSQRWGQQIGHVVGDWTRGPADPSGALDMVDLRHLATAADVTKVLGTGAGAIAARDLPLGEALEAYLMYGLAVDQAMRRGDALPQAA